MINIEYKIYKLIDPRNNLPRYIGLTFNSLKYRLKSHRCDKSRTHKCNWIKSILKDGLTPKIEIIESNIYSHEMACEREIYWISEYKKLGYDLTNATTGGKTNTTINDETRLKMSLSQKERYKTYKLVLSDETKKRISESTKRRMQDIKEIEKLKISNKKYEDSKTVEQKERDILIQDNKIVIKYDKDMNYICEYLSIRDANRKTNIDRSNISKCCKNKVKSAGGFIWRFK